jgi:hypothetical protein
MDVCILNPQQCTTDLRAVFYGFYTSLIALEVFLTSSIRNLKEEILPPQQELIAITSK